MYVLFFLQRDIGWLLMCDSLSFYSILAETVLAETDRKNSLGTNRTLCRTWSLLPTARQTKNSSIALTRKVNLTKLEASVTSRNYRRRSWRLWLNRKRQGNQTGCNSQEQLFLEADSATLSIHTRRRVCVHRKNTVGKIMSIKPTKVWGTSAIFLMPLEINRLTSFSLFWELKGRKRNFKCYLHYDSLLLLPVFLLPLMFGSIHENGKGWWSRW